MLFDGPARKAEEGYGKHEDDEDHNDNEEEDDHLCLSVGRWTGLTGRTLTGSWSGCSGTW